jgi:hypothetical protein
MTSYAKWRSGSDLGRALSTALVRANMRFSPVRPLSDQAKRRRRLSSLTRAPCRKVMDAPGQRSQAARKVARATW